MSERHVTFDDHVLTIPIPKNEDRKGYWNIDAMRFRERIKRFEQLFEKTVKYKNGVTN